jgi:hypothetical protein
MLAVALGAALCISTFSAQAATTTAPAAKGPTDMQLYCTFFPMAAKCAPAAAAAPAAKMVAKVAMVKPAPAMAAAPKAAMKTMACVKADAGKGYLFSCTWK